MSLRVFLFGVIVGAVGAAGICYVFGESVRRHLSRTTQEVGETIEKAGESVQHAGEQLN